MAIYHLNVKIIGRSSGRSSVAAAAYRSGTVLKNEWDGLTHDYTKKHWIEHSEILLPSNAPRAYRDRETLWNAVEAAEKSGNAQLAREVEIALPAELSISQNIELARSYVKRYCTAKGMCADFSVHNPPQTDAKGRPIDQNGNPTKDKNKMTFHNPHVHILLTVRPMDEDGNWLPKGKLHYICKKGTETCSIPSDQMREAEADGWQKQYQYKVGKKKVWLTKEEAEEQNLKRISKQPRSEKVPNPEAAQWNSKDTLFTWRDGWASACNKALSDNGYTEMISSRSYEEQGVNRVAGVHMGVQANQMEKRGIRTQKGDVNRRIKETNQFLSSFEEKIKTLEQKESEHLKKLSQRMESLRARAAAAAYQSIAVSALIASTQAGRVDEAALAASYAESIQGITKAIENLTASLEVMEQKRAVLNPFSQKQKKELVEQIMETEKEIECLTGRRKELYASYHQMARNPESSEKTLEELRAHLQSLNQEIEQINKEFWKLAEENKENLKTLRSLCYGKRPLYMEFTKEKLKEKEKENFNEVFWNRAQEQAPDFPEEDGKRQVIHRRR